MIELPVPTTLEMAQEQILTLQEAHTNLSNERDTLNNTLTSERATHTAEIADRDTKITNLREHNQKLFLRASAAILEPETPKPDVPNNNSLEDLARSMKGVF